MFVMKLILFLLFYKGNIENKVLRFCFAKKEKTLEKAAAIINKIV